jgi:alkyl hydroperoxide reductase subunit AhpF
MSLISPADQERLRQSFAEMTRPVRLLFFTQTLDCETCPQTRQILDELPLLSDRITIEEVNLVLERDKAEHYGIDRAPAIVVTYADQGEAKPGEEAAFKDSRIRFLGMPAGYEFITLVEGVRLAGGGQSGLTPENRARMAEVGKPTVLQVFTTPT